MIKKPRFGERKRGSNSFKADQDLADCSEGTSQRNIHDISSQLESLQSCCEFTPSPIDPQANQKKLRLNQEEDKWEKLMICSCGKNNPDCEWKVDSENNSNFIWTSENDNPHQYDSIEEKFETSRISTKGITKYSSNEEAKNVSYELDIGSKLRIEDLKCQRERVNSDSDNSMSFQKKSNQKPERKTFESRYDLNLSLNAQLGEATGENQGANEPISEEEEGMNDDPDYFYMSTSEEFKPKETFAFISKHFPFQNQKTWRPLTLLIEHTYSSGSENIDKVLEENDGIQEESNENVSHRNNEEEKVEERLSDSCKAPSHSLADHKSLKDLKANLKKIESLVKEEIKKLKQDGKRINILLAGPKGIGKTSFMKLFRAQLNSYTKLIDGEGKPQISKFCPIFNINS